jgi:hypothetical protein
MRRTAALGVILSSLCILPGVRAAGPSSAPAGRRVPIIYSSDLFHPHDDPDDHFDLATLFAIREFDIRAILLDQGDRQLERPGAVPLRQILSLTGRSVPSAIGLGRKLHSPEDKALDQPDPFQAGVRLFLRTLRESKEPVTVLQTGSLRDIAAAFNREPALLREKVARLYLNTGHAGGDKEWNVGLDPHAYVRVMRSGLPIYWVPCFGPHGYGSLWKFRHDRVLDAVSPRLQNFFIYALARVSPEKLDPIAALSGGLDPAARAAMWTQERNMWSTASLLHAAGWEPTRSANGSWRLTPLAPEAVSGQEGVGAPATTAPSSRIVWFEKRRVRLDADGKTWFDDQGGDLDVVIFRRGDEAAYNAAMTAALRDLLKNIGN